MRWIVTAAIALLLPASLAHAENAASDVRPGDIYEIRWQQETEETTDGSSSGNSRSHSTYAERVVAVREAGVEVEFDLPEGSSAQAREREWTFPARILKRNDGTLQLLNGTELEARLEIWLEKAKWPREVCGRWYFTWNAFQINCDPQSVLRTFETLDVTRGDAGTEAVDAEAVRRERAEGDVVVGEIMREPVTFEEALAEHLAEQISGMITTSFEREAPERIARTTTTKLEIILPNGVTETRTRKETVTRSLVSRAEP